MTNKEFLQSMNEQDLSDFLSKHVCYGCGSCMCRKNCENNEETCEKNIINWLKETRCNK